MPVYEYECQDCGKAEEASAPMRAIPDSLECQLCHGSCTRVFSVPQVKTASTFQALNGGLGGAQFTSDFVRDHYLTAAREAGVSPEGKFYEGRIARFPGDPEAWVQSQDDVRGVLEKRGWGCDGDIKVKAGGDGAPVKEVPLAADLVEDLVEAKLEERLGPDFTEAKGAVVERARDDVLQQHTPYWAKT